MSARRIPTSVLFGFLASCVAGVATALFDTHANRFVAYGMHRLVVRSVRYHMNHWLFFGVVAGALLWGARRYWSGLTWAWFREARMGDLFGAFVRMVLPLLAMDIFLYGVFLRGRSNPDFLLAHVIIGLFLLAVAAFLRVVFSGPLHRSWQRFVGRSTGDDETRRPRALRRVFAVSVFPFIAVDVAMLLVYHVRVSFFISPIQLMSYEALMAKLAFDLAAIGLLVHCSRVRSTSTSRRWPRATVGIMAVAALFLLIAANLAPLALRRSRALPNVVLVVVDALRADRLGAYGYGRDTSPHLDELAARGVIFHHAYSCATSTKLAVPCLLTSLFPLSHGVTDEASVLSREALTLTEILANAGYATRFYNAGNIYLHSRFGFTQGFDRTFFRFPVSAEQLTNEFLGDLSQMAGRPFFAYLHYMDVHTPYNRNEFSLALDLGPHVTLEPGGMKLANPEALDLDASGRAALSDLYDAQISYTDQQIGRVISGLDELGLTDNTLIVITSDHGEEFWEHGHFGHGRAPFEEVLRIPMILAGHGVEGEGVASRVKIMDVLPTVVELTGVDRGQAPIQGTTMGGLGAQDMPSISRPVVGMMSLGGKGVFGLLHGSFKLLTAPMRLVDLETQRPRGVQLYDLSQDPGERTNLIDKQPDEVSKLEEMLTVLLRSGPSLAKGETVIDSRERELLEALGYSEQ